MNLLIVPFIETTIPVGLLENEWGVAHHVLLTKGSFKKDTCRWSIQIMMINGIWYGTSSACTTTGCHCGYCGPCTRSTTPFVSVEECIDYHYRKVCEFFKREDKGIPKRPSFKDFEEAYPYNL